MRLRLVRPQPLAFLVKNLRSPVTYEQGLMKVLPFWLRGFGSEQVALYELTRANRGAYLPDFLQYRITLATNRNVWPILHDKLLFDAFMRGRLPLSPLLLALSDGRPLRLGGDYGLEAWFAEIAAGQPFVVKPLQGGGGSGLSFVRLREDGSVERNGRVCSWAELRDWVQGLAYHGVYRREQQHPVLAELYAPTTNTLRLHIFRSDAGTPEILGAALRVGVARSLPVDNFNQGALSIHVDPLTGVTGVGIARGPDGRPVRLERHPESGRALAGIAIPSWEAIRAALLGFHERLPAFDLVGWDVIVTEAGFVVIEGNHNPQLRTTLVHANLATSEAFRAFCQRRRLLSGAAGRGSTAGRRDRGRTPGPRGPRPARPLP